ncbi:hypothetical protein K438DRAFT_2067463 [Mycena galopus ATCC 62051]|nr:hypothetical protein K438DRAFT_2067463 [Mycena galopus ATCC 62051]
MAPFSGTLSRLVHLTNQADVYVYCSLSVPVYDARSVDFDIKYSQQLPKYDGELDTGMVVMVVFTLGHYSVPDGEKLSLNVQAAVAMHDAVPEEDRPSETVIDDQQGFFSALRDIFKASKNVNFQGPHQTLEDPLITENLEVRTSPNDCIADLESHWVQIQAVQAFKEYTVKNFWSKNCSTNLCEIEDGPDFELLSGPHGRSASSALSVGEDVDELYSDSEAKPVVAVKPRNKKINKAEKTPGRNAKPAKTGEKRAFDLTDLDEAHRQDMADSARRQDNRIELEMKRTELELEREKNKKHKLELEAERMRMEREDRQDRMRRDEERDNPFFSMMSGMMGGASGQASTSSASMSNSSGTSNYRFDDDFCTWNLNPTQ